MHCHLHQNRIVFFFKGNRETSCSSQALDCCTLSLFLAAVWIAMSTLQVTSPGLVLYQMSTQPYPNLCLSVCNIIPLSCCLPEPCQLSLINPTKLASCPGTDPTGRSNCEFDGRVLQWSIFKCNLQYRFCFVQYYMACFLQYPIILSLANLYVICLFLSLNIALY